MFLVESIRLRPKPRTDNRKGLGKKGGVLRGPLALYSLKKVMAEETEFRMGACHAALWFHEEVKRMVAEGKTAPEISERLAALVHVLLDWSGQQVEMPNGKTPWEWDQADLEPYILRRKTEW